MKISLFVKNTVILSVYSVGLRVLGMGFKIILQRRIGAECTGLYQQVFSIYMLLTGAINIGLSMAVTRLLAEKKLNNRAVMRVAICSAVCLSGAVGFGSFILSDLIGRIIGDMRCVEAVRILSFSLPFMAVSACCKGWFASKQRTLPPSNVQLFEQIIRIAVVMFTLTNFADNDISICCSFVFFGDTVAEISSCILIVLLWRIDCKNSSFGGSNKVGREIARIGVPIGASRLGNSILRTAESIVTPNSLTRHYASRSVALAHFGTVRAMALPIMLFPSAVLSAVSSLMIPKLAGESENVIRSRVERAVFVTTKLSFGCAAVMFCVADELGQLIYNNNEVGFVIRILAPILPFMYLQFVVDGILITLDKQTPLMIFSLTDSGLRIAIISLIVPISGVQGLLFVMMFSNIFTCMLSFWLLAKTCKPKLDVWGFFLRPFLCSLLGSTAFFIDFGSSFERLIIKSLLCFGLYRLTVGKIWNVDYPTSNKNNCLQY